MVTLDTVKVSNSLITSTFPTPLVAVFVGATNGVGEVTLKQFAHHARKPRVYFIGRSQEAGDRIAAECKAINPEGEFIFLKRETSTIRSVDEVCEEIKSKEKFINILMLTIGTLQSGIKTEEGLHYASALAIHARNRFIANLLPLLRTAPFLRRVVTTFLGGLEGGIKWDDFQGWHLNLMANRGHAASITTLALEHHAKCAPEVSFIHNFPGPVKSGIARGTQGVLGAFLTVFQMFGPLVNMPPADAGDRHVYLCTSSKYPPVGGADVACGVELGSGVEVATGTDGVPGSGVYSVDVNGESASHDSEGVLAQLRGAGAMERVWGEIEGEFVRITGKV